MKRTILAGISAVAVLSGIVCFGADAVNPDSSTNQLPDPKIIQAKMERLMGERREVRNSLLAVEERISAVLQKIQTERRAIIAKDAELQALQQAIAAKQAEFEALLAAKSGKSATMEKEKTDLLKQHSELTRKESEIVVQLDELRFLKK